MLLQLFCLTRKYNARSLKRYNRRNLVRYWEQESLLFAVQFNIGKWNFNGYTVRWNSQHIINRNEPRSIFRFVSRSFHHADASIKRLLLETTISGRNIPCFAIVSFPFYRQMNTFFGILCSSAFDMLNFALEYRKNCISYA